MLIGEELEHSPHTVGHRWLIAAVSIDLSTAIAISALQVWSRSAATPAECIGRPLLILVFGYPLLTGRAWARWPLLLLAVATTVWLAVAAVQAPILAPWARGPIGLLALAAFAGALLPWHPQVRRLRAGRQAAVGAPAA
jgi:hypothetical protein